MFKCRDESLMIVNLTEFNTNYADIKRNQRCKQMSFGDTRR